MGSPTRISSILADFLRSIVHDPARPLSLHSGGFVVLFFGFTILWVLLREHQTWRYRWLLFFSFYYYYRCNGRYALVLAGLCVADWLIGRRLHRTQSRMSRKAWAIFGVSLNLASLGIFKYLGFFLREGSTLLGLGLPAWEPFLPIGISFHVFQSISYLVDIYKKRQEPSKGLLEYALYLSFFPQVVAGPIVRASEFFPQIRRKLDPTSEEVSAGLYLVLQGVVKKVVLADYLGGYTDLVLGYPSAYCGFELLLATYAYAAQIFLDFAGYTDIALGLGRILGVRLPENFNAPYASRGLRDFWRRWHISLSSWLRDYLYLPLGGNRVSDSRHFANLLLTMVLGGLWHGASWTFLAWGTLHGLALCLTEAFRKNVPIPKAIHMLSAPLTFHWVAALWILFRAKTIGEAAMTFRRLPADWHWSSTLSLANERAWVILATVTGILWAMLAPTWTSYLRERFVKAPWPVQAALALGVVEGVLAVSTSTIRPFIYFQF